MPQHPMFVSNNGQSRKRQRERTTAAASLISLFHEVGGQTLNGVGGRLSGNIIGVVSDDQGLLCFGNHITLFDLRTLDIRRF
jgi:hypothetical protein